MYMKVIFYDDVAYFETTFGWRVLPAFGCGRSCNEVAKIRIPADATVDGVRIVTPDFTFSARLRGRELPLTPPVVLPEKYAWCTISRAAADAVASLAENVGLGYKTIHVDIAGIFRDTKRVAKIKAVPLSCGGFPQVELNDFTGVPGSKRHWDLSPHLPVSAGALAGAIRDALASFAEPVTFVTAREWGPSALFVVGGTPEEPFYIAEIPAAIEE